MTEYLYFTHPILNSPYKYTNHLWELDEEPPQGCKSNA